MDQSGVSRLKDAHSKAQGKRSAALGEMDVDGRGL
jgi:hypothetical protein